MVENGAPLCCPQVGGMGVGRCLVPWAVLTELGIPFSSYSPSLLDLTPCSCKRLGGSVCLGCGHYLCCDVAGFNWEKNFHFLAERFSCFLAFFPQSLWFPLAYVISAKGAGNSTVQGKDEEEPARSHWWLERGDIWGPEWACLSLCPLWLTAAPLPLDVIFSLRCASFPTAW